MFSCEFCEISKNTFFYRTPPVAASEVSKTDFDKINLVKLFGNNYSYRGFVTLNFCYALSRGVHTFEYPIYRKLPTFHQLINVAKVEPQSISTAIF